MKFNLKNEMPFLLIAIVPFLYLLAIWTSLPDTVPTHWNIKGEIDGTGKKETLVLIPFLLPVLTYLLFLIAPSIDPKKKLHTMGDKLTKLKFAVTLTTSILAIFILHSVKHQELSSNRVIILIGAMFAVFGNFLPVVKPNFFIGIRIPWTLNNDNNWKLTHRFAGKLWLIGGIAIILYSLFTNPENASIFFLSVTFVIVILPVLYSFRLYQNTKHITPK